MEALTTGSVHQSAQDGQLVPLTRPAPFPQPVFSSSAYYNVNAGPNTQYHGTVNGRQPGTMVAYQPNALQAESRELVELLTQPAIPRADAFGSEEVNTLLEEVKLRKHILLSASPTANRLKRRAWEEVANSMTRQYPEQPERTISQVRKKWENLVTQTKRRIRNGQVTFEDGWNETNLKIAQFLLQHCSPSFGRLVDGRYLSALPPAVSETTFVQENILNSIKTVPMFNNAAVSSEQTRSHILGTVSAENSKYMNTEEVMIKIDEPETGFVSTIPLQNIVPLENPHELPWTCSTNSTSTILPSNPVVNSSASAVTIHTGVNTSSPPSVSSTSSSIPPGVPPEVQQRLLEQMQREHDLRLSVLRLQQQAWQIQVQLLEAAVKGRSGCDKF